MAAKGFTLIELMIVLIIIGILATVGIVQYQSAVEKSRGAEAKTVIANLRRQCEALYLETGMNDCNATNLHLGTATTDEYPTSCSEGTGPLHFFQYAVTASGTTAVFTAKRCAPGTGRTPGYQTMAGVIPFMNMTCNFANATPCRKLTAYPPGAY